MIDAHWQQFCSTLRQLGAELLEAAPDEETRTEGAAYLARLSAYGVERFLMGPERLTNGISFNVARIGGYNPDYRVGSANLQSDRCYRLRGKINQAHRIGVGAYSVQPDGRIATDSYRVLTGKDPSLSADGRFDLMIAPGAPEGGLALSSTSNLLLIREIRLRPDDVPADLALACDVAAELAQAPSVAQVERSLTAAQHFITGSLRQFLHWSQIFAERPNDITPLPPELDKAVQGDPGTRYYSGYFHLRDDQALVIEVPPIACDYWGMQITNHWLEPLPASHLNHVTTTRDTDGIARIVIAGRDPGRKNWLATGGRSRGVIFHRRINADPAEAPRCHLLP